MSPNVCYLTQFSHWMLPILLLHFSALTSHLTTLHGCRWVMLKNVHLAPGWLVQLEKKLHSLHPHPQFRLFLTMEITPRLPVNLLRAGRVFVFEPPPGVRANLLRTFSTVRLTLGLQWCSWLDSFGKSVDLWVKSGVNGVRCSWSVSVLEENGSTLHPTSV